MVVLGVVADTHVPDRRPCLSPKLLASFRSAGVAAILHAGDISTSVVLDELGQIAPVYAVRGNRDIYHLRALPISRLLTFEGVRVGLTHGHGSLWQYFLDKGHYMLHGLEETHYVSRVIKSFSGAGVIVFGHIHMPIIETINGCLIFNPGVACCSGHHRTSPSAGLLYINSQGAARGEIFPL